MESKKWQVEPTKIGWLATLQAEIAKIPAGLEGYMVYMHPDDYHELQVAIVNEPVAQFIEGKLGLMGIPITVSEHVMKGKAVILPPPASLFPKESLPWMHSSVYTAGMDIKEGEVVSIYQGKLWPATMKHAFDAAFSTNQWIADQIAPKKPEPDDDFEGDEETLILPEKGTKNVKISGVKVGCPKCGPKMYVTPDGFCTKCGEALLQGDDEDDTPW